MKRFIVAVVFLVLGVAVTSCAQVMTKSGKKEVADGGAWYSIKTTKKVGPDVEYNVELEAVTSSHQAGGKLEVKNGNVIIDIQKVGPGIAKSLLNPGGL